MKPLVTSQYISWTALIPLDRHFLDTHHPYGKISALAEIAQLVEHATENCGVDSSILSLGTLTSKAPPFGGFLFP